MIDHYVYHGSETKFDDEIAKPKRQIRSQKGKDGERKIIFDEESFHATPHKWIALAYTYNGRETFEISGKKVGYNMGVSLYEDNNTVVIFGRGSLEESLAKLYGKGGYLYCFDKNKFIHKEGLGNLEVIVNEPIKPLSVERIEDPVGEMKKLKVTFNFVDLELPENEEDRRMLQQ